MPRGGLVTMAHIHRHSNKRFCARVINKASDFFIPFACRVQTMDRTAWLCVVLATGVLCLTLAPACGAHDHDEDVLDDDLDLDLEGGDEELEHDHDAPAPPKTPPTPTVS